MRPVSSGIRTAADWLSGHAARAPERLAFAVGGGRGSVERVTYGELARLAARLAGGLRRRGVAPGARVLVCLPNGIGFPATLLACLYTGAIAVPAPPPRTRRVEAFRLRLAGIVADCDPALLVSSATLLTKLAAILPGGLHGRLTGWEELPEDAVAEPVAEPGDVALLQYTSGSTGRPKGVVVTHEALAASCWQAAWAYGEQPDDTVVTWVPLFHDMGLITGVMRPLHTGYSSVLLSPEQFVQEPLRWLRAIDAHRATLTSAPNFAFDLCVRKVSGADAARLDLRCLRVARNAGEPVKPETADRFTRHFAVAGIAPEAFCPSYGLAEATLAVTTSRPGAPAARLRVNRSALAANRVVVAPPAAGSGGEQLDLLSSGTPLPGTTVTIRPPTSGADVGEIVVSGPQLSAGYWPQADGVPALATGDLGFLHDGHLFVLGRADDTLVLHGRKHYLADIMAVCAEVEGVRAGRLAAFVVHHEVVESVRLIAETRPGGEARSGGDWCAEALAALRRRLQLVLKDRADLLVSVVTLVPPGALPVTTSGKVRISEARRRLEAGELPVLEAATPA